MSGPQLEIQLIAVVVAAACALPGAFLVLRRMSLLTDAISHSILLGIVVAFFLTRDLASPLLLVAAAATGVLTAALVELIKGTGLLKEDAAIGLVFPLLFSLGVVLISYSAGNVHLDTDAVLLGELAFAPFRRLVLFGVDLGPKTLAVMAVILVANLGLIGLFFKELKLSTFDPQLAAALGFSPVLIHYGLMSAVSVTAVGAFDSVGAILVVALMIAPAAAAHLLTDRLAPLLGISVAIAVAAAIGGYWLAHWLDASIAGSMATAVGVLFALVYLGAPERGLLALLWRSRERRYVFAQATLTIHLLQHEGSEDELVECRLDHLTDHLRWSERFARAVTGRATARGLVAEGAGGRLGLTPLGRTAALETAARLS